MERIVKDIYVIDDAENVESRIRTAAGCELISLDDSIDFINFEISTIFYIDSALNVKPEGDKSIIYAWLDTGYVNQAGEPIFISLLKDGSGIFVGNFVGSPRALAGKVSSFYSSNRSKISENQRRFLTKYEKRISKRAKKHLEIPDASSLAEENPAIRAAAENAAEATLNPSEPESPQPVLEIPKTMTPITEEIADILLVKNWRTMEGLDRYIKIVGCRAKQLVRAKADDYYVSNHLGYIIANTGLLNQYGSDILVYYRTNMKYDFYEAYEVIYGKTDFLENGFTKEQARKRIRPISFLDDGDVFTADIDDFDLNYRNLQHIIDKRRDRFPEPLQELPTNTVATRLISALEQGLKMQQRDKSYIKAHYSAKTRDISWLLPFHIDTHLGDEPELVLVIRKNREFYELKTILPYDNETKDRITALSLYAEIW